MFAMTHPGVTTTSFNTPPGSANATSTPMIFKAEEVQAAAVLAAGPRNQSRMAKVVATGLEREVVAAIVAAVKCKTAVVIVIECKLFRALVRKRRRYPRRVLPKAVHFPHRQC